MADFKIDNTIISKKPKVLLAGVILLVLLVIFYSFFVRKLMPIMEKVYVWSAPEQPSQLYQ